MFLATFFVLMSCVSVPKQAPLLSEDLGQKINTLEKSHLNLLHAFFDEKRNLVNQFINEEWMPEFANEFYSNDAIQAAWDEIVGSDNKNKRMKFLLMVGPRLQIAIDKKRRELIQPLDDLENQIAGSIREEYTMARSINTSITNYLHSAAEVSENQQRYLNKLNITEDRISKVIDQTDDIVGKLAETADKVVDKEEEAREYLEKIKDIKAQLLN